MTEGKVYKIRASRETSDYLPFVKAGDQFTAELGEANYLQNFKLTLEKSTTSNQTN